MAKKLMTSLKEAEEEMEFREDEVAKRSMDSAPMRAAVLLGEDAGVSPHLMIIAGVSPKTLMPLLKQKIDIAEAIRTAMTELLEAGSLPAQPRQRIERITLHAARLGGTISDAVKEILEEQKIL